MDGIQPYSGSSRSPNPHANPVNPTLIKVPSDYLRALRRRIWLILAIGVPLSVAGAVLVVRQQSIYQAKADIMIEPPVFDPFLNSLVGHEIGHRDSETLEKYVPNRSAQLRSRRLAEIVVNDPSVARPYGPGDDPAQELINSIQTRQIPNSNHFQVTLEGTDPERTKRLLDTLLNTFKRLAWDELQERAEATKQYAMKNLNTLKQELGTLDSDINKVLRTTKTIGPGGKSLKEDQYLASIASLTEKKRRLGEIQQQSYIAQYFPNARTSFGSTHNEGLISQLEVEREKLTGQMRLFKRRVRANHFDTDPSVRYTADKLESIMERLDQLRSDSNENGMDPAEAIIANMLTEIRAEEEASRMLLKELQESMPEHQKFLTMLEERKQKAEQIGTLQEKISDFVTLSTSQKNPIWIPETIAEPTAPIRPKRGMNIVMGIFFSFGLGIGLVCLLEYHDHSVTVPEHLTMGLRLPLFGVVPRIRRTALTHRGGHLWTPGAPDSIEADAYRNLRASLLGVSDKHGPIVTLLVTSAKAGEGKSTTALNLAATCARAGERTLLMDVDLRRPSLADVFREDEERKVGLVDVLRGDLPWQRTVVRTDIPNLDFLPTGDTRDIPIEILGTLELRQLLIALASHYDRVILDGPAILGLADCRMLGRVVDAALLVVRSGAHELRPLQRAKAMLEQSHVVIAGVVFNALFDDLHNWSSYGPNMNYGYPEITSGLAAPSDERAALPSVGSYPS